MKVFKVLLSAVVFYFFVLLETSFFVHFGIFNYIPNLILLSVIAWNIFENPKDLSGIFGAIIGGFLLDIFSSHPIGYNVLILVTTAIFIKIIIRKYVQLPFVGKV